MAVGPAPTAALGVPTARLVAAPAEPTTASLLVSPLVTLATTIALCLLSLDGAARRYNDTPSYFHLDLSGGGRLPVVPLLFSTLSAGSLIVVVQAIVAGASWGWLGYETQALFARRGSQIAAVAGTIFVGTSASVSSWNGALLSESLSITLLAAIGAASLAFVQRQTHASAAVLGAVSLLWLLCRQQNVFLGLVAVGVATPFLLSRGSRLTRRTFGVIALLCILVVPYALRNQQVRTMNLAQVVSARVLVDASTRQWWYEHGLPRHSCLERDVGVFPGCIAHDRRIRTWLEDSAAATYASWLTAHPTGALLSPLRFGLASQVQPGMRQERTVPALLFAGASYAPSRLDGLDVLADDAVGQLLLLLTASGMGWHLVRRRRLTVAETVAAAMFVLALLWLYPSWLGAGFELVRVSVSSAVLAKLALVVGIIAVVDATIPDGRSKRTSAA